MHTAVMCFPEDLVIAILHKVGNIVRIVDDNHLAKIFNDAAENKGANFSQFAWHSQYHYSKLLSDTLQTLDQGGSIIRENPATTYFRISEHTAGPYGESKYMKLEKEDRDAVDEIAQAICAAFKSV